MTYDNDWWSFTKTKQGHILVQFLNQKFQRQLIQKHAEFASEANINVELKRNTIWRTFL